jgi:hypothetical protein
MIKDWEQFIRLHAAALDSMIDREDSLSRRERLSHARQQLETLGREAGSRSDHYGKKAEHCRLLAEFCDSAAHRRRYADLASIYERAAEGPSPKPNRLA